MRERVIAARWHQQTRQGCSNALLATAALAEHVALDAHCVQLLDAASEHFRLSERARQRVLRVARTIADLEGDRAVAARHLEEALSYRVNLMA